MDITKSPAICGGRRLSHEKNLSCDSGPSGLCSFFAGCGEKEAPRTIKEYPLDNMAGVLTQSNVVSIPPCRWTRGGR
jgi:hypothetical protein